MISLALDASTYTGTVAVFDGERLLASGEAAMRGRDAERLMPLVLDVLARAGLGIGAVEQVICGQGPGSFTSLRIAASIAKGIAVGRGIPLLPVSSLALIVAANAPRVPRRYLATLDALRGESYAQSIEVAPDGIRFPGQPVIVRHPQLPALAEAMAADLVGPNVAANWAPHARGALRILPPEAADLASWEPDYGRKAEAQSRWEAELGRELPA